jgi:hypothetical protein
MEQLLEFSAIKIYGRKINDLHFQLMNRQLFYQLQNLAELPTMASCIFREKAKFNQSLPFLKVTERCLWVFTSSCKISGRE